MANLVTHSAAETEQKGDMDKRDTGQGQTRRAGSRFMIF